MDQSCLLRMKLLTVFLLVSANTVSLRGNPVTGVDNTFHCVNDYLFTINCSLSFAPSENTSDSKRSYWLTFTKEYELKTFLCILTKISEGYFCSFKTSNEKPDEFYAETFGDTDIFEISLCHSQNNTSEVCELLEKEYTPETNIKPNAPCCLTVSHDFSRYNFTWKSTYEEYSRFTALTDNMKFQLHYYKRGGEQNEIPQEINTELMSYSVDNQKFVPDTEYSARVRSSPNQASYKGQWSDWSPEIYWKTEAAVTGLTSKSLDTAFVSRLSEVFIPLFVMVPVLLLCYFSAKKWRQSAHIPTPAPYFHTLYTDCQGDFKSWVVTPGKTTAMLKEEETLQIDTLSKCVDIQEECVPQFQHQFIQDSSYSNMSNNGCSSSLLGIPYAVSTMDSSTALGTSLNSLNISLQFGSPAEDSGCCFCSHMSLERDPPLYCNEYCTLNAFHQSCPVTAENHGSL